jgi:hypothetical protein
MKCCKVPFICSALLLSACGDDSSSDDAAVTDADAAEDDDAPADDADDAPADDADDRAVTEGDAGGGDAGAGPEGPVCPPKCGPPTSVFLDNDRLAELRLTIDEQTTQAAGYFQDEWLDLLWEKWQHCGPYSNYIKTTMEYVSPDGLGDEVLENVGMRLRGSKSRGTNELQGFKLSFDTSVEEGEADIDPADDEKRRRFADLNRINTLSVESDPSLMIQCLAYKFARNFGVPSPRCNHLKVYVNDEFYGLMQNVEEVDTGRFLKHYFGTTDGALYECSGGCDRVLPDGNVVTFSDSLADLRYYGDEFEEPYLSSYNPQRGQENPTDELIPMLECGDDETTPDDEQFRECISEWIDVEEWLKVLALESVMPTLESFMVARNYYLYFHPDLEAPHGARFLLYSWDYDTAMHRQSCSPPECDPFTAVAGWYTGNQRPRLAQRLTRVFKAEYCAAMTQFLDEVYVPEVVDELAASIEQGIDVMLDQDDPLYDFESWQAEVLTARDFVIARSASAREQVETGCGDL